LGGRKGIRPVKTERWGAGMVICLELGADLSLASVKSRLVLPFWYRITQVVLEKGPLNVCVCVCIQDNLGKPVLKHKTSLDLNQSRDYGGLGWQWHQLDPMQTM